MVTTGGSSSGRDAAGALSCLLAAAGRQQSGYRLYDDASIQRVRFIRRAQDLGFTLEEIADLLSLWPDSAHACGAVERRATATLERIGDKIRDRSRMREVLSAYVKACRRHESVESCPLLTALGSAPGRSARQHHGPHRGRPGHARHRNQSTHS